MKPKELFEYKSKLLKIQYFFDQTGRRIELWDNVSYDESLITIVYVDEGYMVRHTAKDVLQLIGRNRLIPNISLIKEKQGIMNSRRPMIIIE